MIDSRDLPSLFPEQPDIEPARDRAPHAYARKPNGWIVVTPMAPNLKADYEGRGFEYLNYRYGVFMQGTADPRAVAREQDSRGVPWNPAMEPWRLILQKGGAEEFPVDQVIAYRWHIRPPYREITFPQIEGLDITNYECPECERPTVFSSLNPAEAASMLRTHLTSKINDQHSYTIADLHSLGEELGIDFTRRRVGRAHTVKAIPQETVVEVLMGELEGEYEEEEVEVARDLAYQCQECNWAPVIGTQNPQGALRLHMRRKHGT